MEIIRNTSLGKMVPCRCAQCNHSYCVSCSTAVLVILVILIVLLTATVETGVWGRGRVGGWVGCGHVHTCVCMDMFVHACMHVRVYIHACVHLCGFVHDCRVCECMCHWVCGFV